jgi:hypothetical protein
MTNLEKIREMEKKLLKIIEEYVPHVGKIEEEHQEMMDALVARLIFSLRETGYTPGFPRIEDEYDKLEYSRIIQKLEKGEPW